MKKSIIRNVIIIAVVIILGVVGYKLFLSKKTPTPTGGLQTTAGVGAGTSGAPQIATTSAASPTDTSIGGESINTLLSVQSISLDEKIFTSKAFTLLQDFNRPIPADTNPGRTNPFAPIGTDGTTVSVQVSTSNPSSITSTGATLNGTLVVSDPSATRWFEYGTTNALGMMTTPVAQSTPGTFSETVGLKDKLLSNTTYYVRADASVNGQTVFGNLITWKTAQAAR